MELEEFRNDVLNDLKLSAEQKKIDIEEEIVNYYCDILMDAEEFDDYEHIMFRANGRNNKKIQIDGYSDSETDKSLILFIVNYSNEEELVNIGQTDIKTSIQRLKYFIEHVLDGSIFDYADESDPVWDLAEEIQKNYPSISKLRLYILTDKKIGKKLLTLDSETIEGKSVEINVWDIDRLYKMISSQGGKEEIKINFSELGDDRIECVQSIDNIDNKYSSYIGSIPGELLAKLYTQYGARLLEGNVRSFLSVKGKVNKGIRNTLIHDPEMFFIYNNGIAATASRVTFNNMTNQIEELDDLQIINGGQTTASIANASYNDKVDLSNVVVPIKLTLIKKTNYEDEEQQRKGEEEFQQTITNIARFANSQNKVDESDFFSSNPYCIRLEDYSRRIMSPAVDGNQYSTYWFFERARGQYFQEQMKFTKSQKDHFKITHPKNQVLKKIDIAKFEQSYDMLPQVVSQGAQVNTKRFADKITKRWLDDENYFNELYYKRLIAKAILFKSTERLVSDSDWYKEIKSYRANIVTYTIAALRLAIDSLDGNYQLDLDRIWGEQKLYPELISTINTITYNVYEVITGERSTMNVTQWCKREGCWDNVKNMEVNFSQDFIDTLVIRDVQKEKDARKEQKVINEINHMKYVVEKGSTYWKKIAKFGLQNNIFKSDKEISILTVAVNMETSGKLPTEKQCKVIFDMDKRFIDSGFKEDKI